jgi:ferritin-like metal-binding protein YciE
LEKVFKEALKDIYYAEKQLMKALGKMAKAANNQELKMGFEQHKEETAEQIEKLDQVFEILGMRAQGKKCPAMDGLIEEGSEAMEEFDKGPARDAALIASAQKSEHYEIATYGTLRSFAEIIGEDECARIFEEILEQESATDEKLTMISRTVNQEAMAVGEEEEEMEMEEQEA